MVWRRLSFPPANYDWFPGAWKYWWPIYRECFYIKVKVKRWFRTTYGYEIVIAHRERQYYKWRKEQDRKRVLKNNQRISILLPLLDARIKLREENEYERADKIRELIERQGFRVLDNSDGTSHLIQQLP